MGNDGLGGHRGGIFRPSIAAALLALGNWAAWADTPPGGYWEPVPALWDEFNGTTLDDKKWNAEPNRFRPGHKPGMHMARNVVPEGNELVLWSRAENVANAPPGYRDYTTSSIVAREMMLYGYIEVRAKVSTSRINDAFWLYRWTQTGTYEIDIFEIAGTAPDRQNLLHMNTHVYLGDPDKENDQNRRSRPTRWQHTAPLKDAYHVYGLEWSERELKWYLDGRVIRAEENFHFHQPMKVILSAETHPDWFGLPAAGELPAAYRIDYIRAWKRKTAAD